MIMIIAGFPQKKALQIYVCSGSNFEGLFFFPFFLSNNFLVKKYRFLVKTSFIEHMFFTDTLQGTFF